MIDLKEAIQAVISNAYPIKLGDSKIHVGYSIGKYDFDVLVGEYNIHFVEPEDAQMRADNDPLMQLIISSENIVEKNDE